MGGGQARGQALQSSSPPVSLSSSSVFGVGRSSPSGPSRRTMNVRCVDGVGVLARDDGDDVDARAAAAGRRRRPCAWGRPVAVRPVEDLARADEDVGVEQARVVARRCRAPACGCRASPAAAAGARWPAARAPWRPRTRPAPAGAAAGSSSRALREGEAPVAEARPSRTRSPCPARRWPSPAAEPREHARPRVGRVEQVGPAGLRAPATPPAATTASGSSDRHAHLLVDLLAQIVVADRQLRPSPRDRRAPARRRT